MRVGVVGAGMTGLALTHFLGRRGADVVTFEADDRPGGVVRTVTHDGTILEAGPQRIRLTGPLRDLVAELGLEEDLVVADGALPLYVYADGRLRRVPRTLREFLRTDLLSWRGKLRVLAEPLTAAGDPDETAAALFTRKFGRQASRNILEPLFGGIYGSDPTAMPARYALDGLLDLEDREGTLLKPALRRARRGGVSAPAVTFRDGMDHLPEALYQANRDRISLGEPVESIGERDGGWLIETASGREPVDAVVVTTPADVAATLLGNIAPGGDRLAELRYNPLALVYLQADHDRAGLGYQVRRDEPLRTLGVSWNGSAFGRDGLHTCFLGGMTDQEIVDTPEETVGSTARREFETVMDCPASVLAVERLARGFPAYDDSWHALADLSLPDGVYLATNYTARMGVPSRVREARTLADRLTAD